MVAAAPKAPGAAKAPNAPVLSNPFEADLPVAAPRGAKGFEADLPVVAPSLPDIGASLPVVAADLPVARRRTTFDDLPIVSAVGLPAPAQLLPDVQAALPVAGGPGLPTLADNLPVPADNLPVPVVGGAFGEESICPTPTTRFLPARRVSRRGARRAEKSSGCSATWTCRARRRRAG